MCWQASLHFVLVSALAQRVRSVFAAAAPFIAGGRCKQLVAGLSDFDGEWVSLGVAADE